jgi:hypothetical protein
MRIGQFYRQMQKNTLTQGAEKRAVKSGSWPQANVCTSQLNDAIPNFILLEESLEDLLREGQMREQLSKMITDSRHREQEFTVGATRAHPISIPQVMSSSSCVFIDETDDASHTDNVKRLHSASPSKVLYLLFVILTFRNEIH